MNYKSATNNTVNRKLHSNYWFITQKLSDAAGTVISVAQQLDQMMTRTGPSSITIMFTQIWLNLSLVYSWD